MILIHLRLSDIKRSNAKSLLQLIYSAPLYKFYELVKYFIPNNTHHLENSSCHQLCGNKFSERRTLTIRYNEREKYDGTSI